MSELLGVSLLLIAIGAILAFAVTVTVQGLLITTAGFVLMAVGAFGILMWLFLLMGYSFGYGPGEPPP